MEKMYHNLIALIVILFSISFLPYSSNALEFSLSKEELETFTKQVRQTFTDLDNDIALKYGKQNEEIFSLGFKMHNPEYLTAKILNSLFFKKKFIYVFSGSSLTAAENCYFNESYVHVFDKIMKPTFNAFQIDLEVHNIANNNNPIEPYDYCIHARAGSDVDVLSWEQDMVAGPKKRYPIELFIRNGLSIPSHPAILITLPSPNVFSVKFAGTMDARMYGSKYDKTLRQVYNEYGLHTYSAWKSLRERAQAYAFRPELLMSEGKSFGDQGYNPSPSGHEFIAYNIGKGYHILFEKAMATLEELFEKSSSADDFKVNVVKFIEASNKVNNWKLPPTAFSKHPYSIHPATCITLYEGRVNYDFDLLKYVVDTEVEDLRPSIYHQGKHHPTWTIRIHPQFIPSMERREAEGSLSKRYVIYGNNENGILKIEFESKLSNELRVCGVKEMVHGNMDGMALLDKDVRYEIDSVGVEAHMTEDENICAVINMAKIKPGKHILSVIPLNSKHVGISNIAWN